MQTAPWKEHVVAEAGDVVYVAPTPLPDNARVWFFTRKGGVSKPPYDSLNVSTLVGDEPYAVAENLSHIKSVMENRPSA